MSLTSRYTGPGAFRSCQRYLRQMKYMEIINESVHFADRNDEAVVRLGQLIRDGRLRYRENIIEGLENAPQAFIDLFDGKNFGKQLVRLAETTEQHLDHHDAHLRGERTRYVALFHLAVYRHAAKANQLPALSD